MSQATHPIGDAFERRLAACLSDMQARGLRRGLCAPLHYRIAWRLGIRLRPPVYSGSVATWVREGLISGAEYGGFFWIGTWILGGEPFGMLGVVVAAGFFGLLMGGVMWRQYYFGIDRLRLPRWEQYPLAGA